MRSWKGVVGQEAAVEMRVSSVRLCFLNCVIVVKSRQFFFKLLELRGCA